MSFKELVRCSLGQDFFIKGDLPPSEMHCSKGQEVSYSDKIRSDLKIITSERKGNWDGFVFNIFTHYEVT